MTKAERIAVWVLLVIVAQWIILIAGAVKVLVS